MFSSYKQKKEKEVIRIDDIKNDKQSRNLHQKYLYVACCINTGLADKVICILNAHWNLHKKK